jgi:SAM-dependent methyltransferase
MIHPKTEAALAAATFKTARRLTDAYSRLSLPIISTGRSFRYYRQIFYGSRSAASVLSALQGQRILDIGCGLTPFVSDSMFQACYRAGIDFYGVDPKLAGGFRFGIFDRAKVRATGGGTMNPDAAGIEHRIGATADALPFDEGSVDTILSCYLLFAWISDETVLEGIFREFDRVLKPGGAIMIFPAPHYDPASIRRPGLRQLLDSFALEQRFFSGLLPVTRFPPAYRMTLRKAE